MMPLWKDDRTLQLINSHRLQWLILVAHLEQEKLRCEDEKADNYVYTFSVFNPSAKGFS